MYRWTDLCIDCLTDVLVETAISMFAVVYLGCDEQYTYY